MNDKEENNQNIESVFAKFEERFSSDDNIKCKWTRESRHGFFRQYMINDESVLVHAWSSGEYEAFGKPVNDCFINR